MKKGKEENNETKDTKKKKASKTVEAQVEFKFRNATKGAIRFQEVDEDGRTVEDEHAIGSLYLRKNWLDLMGFKGEPESCTVMITIR